ncbi:MAG: hypothetical protein KTR27_09420 [Leptolyngbyaceae cyanobacterium MAG.088]|nr:hypothetical protein [Leptolyngbyaceae cyanobacterium MAG.088]
MSRLPRRSVRVKPPLRGRAATKQYRGNFASLTTVRRPSRPYGSAPLPPGREPLYPPPGEVVPPMKPPQDVAPPATYPPENSLYADLVDLYKRWGRFLRGLDQPWQWLVALAIVLSSLLLLNRLL